MNARSGKMALLLILLLVMFFLAFALTPFALAPLGVFTGFAHGVKSITMDAWHFRPWFPFSPSGGRHVPSFLSSSGVPRPSSSGSTRTPSGGG